MAPSDLTLGDLESPIQGHSDFQVYLIQEAN